MQWSSLSQACRRRLRGCVPSTTWVCFLLAIAFWPCFATVAQTSPVTNTLTLAELQSQLAEQSRVIASFRLEAVVCGVAHDGNLLALQDDTGSALIEVPGNAPEFHPGDRVEIAADHCAVTRSCFGLQLGTAPVVNNEGHHAATLKSGKIFLESGLQPIRVTWFNGRNVMALKVEYEGPGISRQIVPNDVLFRKQNESAGGSFPRGLDFHCYTGTDWMVNEPDFKKISPVTNGMATNFDLGYRIRDEDVALAFDGFIKIATAGVYRFYVTSDDGAYLYAGNPAASCRVMVVGREAVPAPAPAPSVATGETGHRWVGLKGEIIFASQQKDCLKLDVASQGEPIHAEIIGGGSLTPLNLLHRRVGLVGILENVPNLEGHPRRRLVVPGPEQVKLEAAADAALPCQGTNRILTTVRQIRDLSPADAEHNWPVQIRGVVIWSSPSALVLQDDTGGVYTHYSSEEWSAQPSVGEWWELNGVSDPGNFSPVLLASGGRFLGKVALPEPIRPTWGQLLNGSLDAEYIELRGALTDVSPLEMTLLTSEGKIKLYRSDDHPLPYLPELADGQSYVDSMVRIRGCYTAHWDGRTRQVTPGQVSICPGVVEIEQLAPRDPFSVPAKTVADLLRFDPNLNILRRSRVKGQVVLATGGDYYVQDATGGLRVRPRQPLPLPPGEWVDAVGFVQLGGPSPILEEAQVRTNGMAAQPAPVAIADGQLRNGGHDSTRVTVEAILVDDHQEEGRPVLELQAGQTRFTARFSNNEINVIPPELGSRLQLTGVYVSPTEEKAGGSLEAFELWLNGPDDLTVLQQPPWWTLRRALTMVGALCGVLALAVIWIGVLRRQVKERTRQLQKEIEERQWVEQRRIMEQERTRVAQDLHDELGAGLTEVGLLGDLVKNPIVPDPEKHHYLAQLTEIARSLVTSLDAIVWAINPRYDSAASLASYYTLFAQRFLNLAGIACRPEIPADFPECALDSKARHGLFLAFKEALNNVVRHAGATEVRLKMELHEDELIIIVADNGAGIQPVFDSAESEGLTGMRRRMEQLGGSCEIRSQPGHGTEVELRLAVGNLVA